MTGYAAYVIDEASRQRLLEAFAPAYPEVVAHHITHKYGATEEDVPAQPREVRVVGYHDSGAIQVLVAEVDGRRYQATQEEDGAKFYHITLSLDRAQGVSARNSNDVLKAIVTEEGEAALANLSRPLVITVTPQLLHDTEDPQAKCPSARPVPPTA